MKCGSFNSIFRSSKKKRKECNVSPQSDCDFSAKDYEEHLDDLKISISETDGFHKNNFEFLNSYVDGCFMPAWENVVEYSPKNKFGCLNDVINVNDLWEDPCGVMELNSRQKKRFHCWIRYFNLCDNLQFFKSPPSTERILQGYVGDCSTVSSLSSLSEYEKLNGPVLSDKIKLIDLKRTVENLRRLSYPPASIDYLKGYKIAIGVKIHFNGCARCVFVDDWVPVRKDNSLLCAHSSDSEELWVTLFEKANVRLYGSTYSIRGTNPGIDIYHLTGWLPEIIQLPPYHYKIPTDKLVKEFNYNGNCGDEKDDITNLNKWNMIWSTIMYNFNKNFVVCLGTNDLYDIATTENYVEGISVSSDKVNSGIVSGHAYSVLDVLSVELEENSYKLLLLKNPWGKISSKLQLDPRVVSVLPYHNRTCDEDDDSGIFWIEWMDVLKWFSHLYLCWNGEMFKYTNKLNFNWSKNRHFINSLVPEDSYLSLFNPQVLLSSQGDGNCDWHQTVRGNIGTAGKVGAKIGDKGHHELRGVDAYEDGFVIFVILVQNKKTLSDKMRYLALHAFEGSSRVITPNNPAVNGVYNNSEVILSKMLVCSKGLDKNEALLRCGKCNVVEAVDCPTHLVLLMCHFMKKIQNDNRFTMVTLSNVPHRLELLPCLTDDFNNLVYDFEWTEYNNGMNPNELWSFFSNPHFRLELRRDVNMVLLLETDAEVSVNLRLFFSRVATIRALRTKQVVSSKDYKLHCCAIQGCFKKGTYTLIPSNFNGAEARFRFNVFHDGSSNDDIDIYPIPYPYVKLGDIFTKNVPRVAESSYHSVLSGGKHGEDLSGINKQSVDGVAEEYKIHASDTDTLSNGGMLPDGDQSVDGTVRRHKILDCFNVCAAMMVNEYLDFKVERSTLVSIRIKVNSVNDNKFVLFSKRCRHYPVYCPNSSRCATAYQLEDRKNHCMGTNGVETELGGAPGGCGSDSGCLKFCNELCCVSCGGSCGQFYPTDRSLFDCEYKLGFEFSVFSDLNGGISKNGRTPSNSAQVLFLKEHVVNFTLVNLFPNVQYRLSSINRFRFQTVFFISNASVISI